MWLAFVLSLKFFLYVQNALRNGQCPSLPFAAACLVARNFYPILCMPTVYQRFTIGRCGAHFLATFCNLSVRADAI